MEVEEVWGTGSTVNTCIVDNSTIVYNCTMKTADGCDFPSGNFIHYKPVSYNINGTVLILLSVMAHLKWTSVCLIFDNDTEQEAISLHHRLSSIGTFVVMYPLEGMTSSKIDDLLRTTSAYDHTSLNFTVLCRLEKCLPFLSEPFDFRRRHVWKSSLLHFSRWLFGIYADGTMSELETYNSSSLDNVAVVQFPSSSLLNSQQQHMFEACQWFPVKTLMWHKDKRGLDLVGYVELKGSFLAGTDIFPNEKFGFNRRKLLVSILPWAPFVEYDNTTNTYSGINLALLKQLSDGLNFTYEFKPPKDGLWGIATENNSWSGLVGQLQRREVDMVAAPIAIQSHRDTVMDFTHPYFYEFSAILSKRPDPDATKWRTLIDPFSPTLFLYIGVSLPLTSFLLCLFEKYNPFYRKVNDRKRVRGLHHYSDSFWYMFGALLTQGGEHIAASSSGRTLLSSWWIFCIITVAIYSGNFVAFFTVAKNRSPIKNLGALISQDTYKWGTAGGTVYETVFMNSELEERRTMWEGIVKFNQTDPSVLGSNPAEHINKVLEGQYAYIADKTYMELAMAKHCDLVMGSADILPLQYAIGLPENSPFTEMFSDEIISILESGLLQVWKQRNWPYSAPCKELSVTEAKKLTIIDLQSAFYLIAIGIFAAGVSLLFEILKTKYVKLIEKRGKLKQKETIRHIKTVPRLSLPDIRLTSMPSKTIFDSLEHMTNLPVIKE